VTQYFEEHPAVPSDRAGITLRVDDRVLTLESDRGVFAHAHIDPGTAVLLRKAPPPAPGTTVLDLGSGYGPIALAMASRAPDATVYAVDVNERALELVADNATANELRNVVPARPDAVPDGVEFDAIYSNPPIRIGKDELHALLRRWLARLRAGGAAYLVVQRHLGADSLHSWLEREGYDVERIASSKGYRVLCVEPGPTPPVGR
jgi:16S rRNA (guanine1207-N2)-methyltransferase